MVNSGDSTLPSQKKPNDTPLKPETVHDPCDIPQKVYASTRRAQGLGFRGTQTPDHRVGSSFTILPLPLSTSKKTQNLKSKTSKPIIQPLNLKHIEHL